MIPFQGSMTALITPFSEGAIDEAALRELVEFQIDGGTKVLVPCGTTGETPTLSDEEYERLISIVVEQTAKRVPILAGAGSNCTEKAIKLTRKAKELGASGTLQVTPYYNKPMQEGLFLHFEKIAAAVDLPLILYNVPSRTGINLQAATTIKLSHIENIIGVKEASGDLAQIEKIIKETDDNFALFSGDDLLNFEIYKRGGKGAISVTGNIAPAKLAYIWNLFAEGKIEASKEATSKLESLNKAMTLETNPIPVKTAASLMGLCKEEFRLPLSKMNPLNKEKLEETLKQYELI